MICKGNLASNIAEGRGYKIDFGYYELQFMK